MKRPSGSRSGGGIFSKVQSDDSFVGVAVEEEVAEAGEDMAMPGGGGGGEKKRRLSTEQVRALKRSFEVENKLEPERKARLARDLGLQLGQVAVWFQNRRARWKTKQLERDHAALCRDHDALRRDRDALLIEIKGLKTKLGNEDAAASFSSVDPPAAAATEAAQVSSESDDSSAVVNDAETTAMEKASVAPEAVVPVSSEARHREVFFHGQPQELLKVEDDEAAFLGDDDAACGGFFTDLQPPSSLPWWTEPVEHWA